MIKIKDLHLPKDVEIIENNRAENYLKIALHPLERGIGTTIGNSLRRMLLSSIPGTAVSAVIIDGLVHEYSAIPNVLEDANYLILNIKNVIFKLDSDSSVKATIDVVGPAEVRAKDIIHTSELSILNPEEYIATVSEGGHLKVDLYIENGRGYIASEEKDKTNYPVNAIIIDSDFSPIVKVDFQVEKVRVGRKADYDKLLLGVKTNGVMTPSEALGFAAKLLKMHYEIFIESEAKYIIEKEKVVDEEKERIRNLLEMSVFDLELGVRAQNCIRGANIQKLKDLVVLTEADMLHYKNFGRKSLNDLKKLLADMGLSFGMDISKYYKDENTENKKENITDEEDDIN